MVGDHVGHDDGEPGFVPGDWKDTGMEADLSHRQGKGVRFRILEEHELPLGVRHFHYLGDPLSDPLQLLHLGPLGNDGFLALHLLKRIQTHPRLLGRVEQEELGTAGLWRRRAAGKNATVATVTRKTKSFRIRIGLFSPIHRQRPAFFKDTPFIPGMGNSCYQLPATSYQSPTSNDW